MHFEVKQRLQRKPMLIIHSEVFGKFIFFPARSAIKEIIVVLFHFHPLGGHFAENKSHDD